MQNNDQSGAVMGIAFVAVAAYFAFMFIFAALAFVSLVLTIICIYCALCGPVQLFGETITLKDAWDFLERGFMGAIAVPTFAIFSSLLFGIRIDPQWWVYIVMGGYVFGSLFVNTWIAQAEAESASQAAQAQLLPPPQQPAPPVSLPVRTIDVQPLSPPAERPEVKPFRFASWDDEEELRK